MFKKLKEKIKFLRWAYAHRNDSRASFEVGQIKYVTSQPKRYRAVLIAHKEDFEWQGWEDYAVKKLASMLADKIVRDNHFWVSPPAADGSIEVSLDIWVVDSFHSV